MPVKIVTGITTWWDEIEVAPPVYATFDHRAEAVYSSAAAVGVV